MPIHPVFIPIFCFINIFLASVPIVNLGIVAHGVVYTAQFIAAGMASAASWYAIRHYRKTDKP